MAMKQILKLLYIDGVIRLDKFTFFIIIITFPKGKLFFLISQNFHFIIRHLSQTFLTTVALCK